MAGSSTISDSFAERWNSSTSTVRRRYHAETASITSAPVTADASSTCRYPHTNTGLDSTAPIEDSSGRPVVVFVV